MVNVFVFYASLRLCPYFSVLITLAEGTTLQRYYFYPCIATKIVFISLFLFLNLCHTILLPWSSSPCLSVHFFDWRGACVYSGWFDALVVVCLFAFHFEPVEALSINANDGTLRYKCSGVDFVDEIKYLV